MDKSVIVYENWGEYKGEREHFSTFKTLSQAREYQTKLEKVFPKHIFSIKER